ncbi:MAG: hypothetical protein ACYTJ0_00860 [Planctomycetota bacterium]|jgi:hypothetical protein
MRRITKRIAGSCAVVIIAGLTAPGLARQASEANDMGLRGPAARTSLLGRAPVARPAQGAAAGLGPCEYAVDDGTGENGLGLLNGGLLVWANAFQATAGCTEISTVRVAWYSTGGVFTPNAAAKVFVYDDPDDDGNPDDAVLLAITDVTTASEGTDNFVDYAIGPVTVSGTFFVGASMAHPASEFPARYDSSSTSAMSSWIGINPTDGDDPLGSTTPIPADDLPNPDFAGNYMVRAIATEPSNPCPTDLDGNGATDVDDLVGVILDWSCTGDDCLGDVPGVSPGIVDVDDLVAVILAWGPCPLLNDACDAATTVFGGTLAPPGGGECVAQATFFTNVGASFVGPAFGCDAEVSADVWFDYTATCDGVVTIDTIGSDFDTVLEVYPTHLFPPDDPLACDNDSAPDGLRSVVTIEVNVGDELKIRVGGGELGAEGNGQLNICCAYVAPPAPENDLCAAAELLEPAPGESVSRVQQTISATEDPEAFSCPEGMSVTAPGVWYKVVGTGRSFTASLCDVSTDYDTVLHVYCGPCEDLKCIGGDDDGCGAPGGPSDVSWCTEAGREYLILVEGFNGATGSFTLEVSQSGATCAPADPCLDEVVLVNDACIDAVEISNGLNAFSTLQATTDGPAHPECEVEGDGGQTGNDIWYLYTADCGAEMGVLRITTCEDLGGSADYDSDLVVYDPSLVKGPVCDSLESAILGCNDDDSVNPCGTQPDYHSTLTVPVVDGQQYLIRVGGFGPGVTGTGELLVECLAATDDICEFATDIEPGGAVQLDTCAATVDGFAPICSMSAPDQPGRWLKVTGTGSELTVTLCNLNDENLPDTRLMVYCGPCDDLECAAEEPFDNNGDCPFTETLTWCSEAGRDYYILVHGQGVPGCGVIDVTLAEGVACDDPPCQPCITGCSKGSLAEGEPCWLDGETDEFNSGCNGATESFGLTLSPGDTVCGTISTYFDPMFDNGAGGNVRDTDWYVFTPEVDGTYTWTATAEFPVHVIIAQLQGPAGTPQCDPINPVGFFGPGECVPQAVSAPLTAGVNYVLFVSVQQESLGGPAVPCDGPLSNLYEATLTGPEAE